MDLRYDHGSDISVVRGAYFDDTPDLVAIAGEHTVEVLRCDSKECVSLANFHLGQCVTAIAWSTRSVSPSVSDDWFLELAVATADLNLYLLNKSPTLEETLFRFGGGLTGHQARINDLAFCGGRSEDNARYVASASDDKALMVWDLHPMLDNQWTASSPLMTSPRPQPTAYAIPFRHPLITVDSHPSTAKEFLVADSRGSLFLTDWRSDPDTPFEQSVEGGGLGPSSPWRHSNVIELVDPRALADGATGLSSQWSGSASWRRDNVEIIGAVYGSKFSIWDLAKLQGGKPLASAVSFSEGGHRFRWCPTYPLYFAVSTQSHTKGALINVHNAQYVNAAPTQFALGARPQRVQDFDFLAAHGVPRIAAAVGGMLVVFAIGTDK